MFESYIKIFDRYGPDILSGLKLTIYITLISIIFGLFLGLILAILKLYGHKILKFLSSLYIEIIRGTPMTVQLFIIYYGLP